MKKEYLNDLDLGSEGGMNKVIVTPEISAKRMVPVSQGTSTFTT
jgi:hypothetical protein